MPVIVWIKRIGRDFLKLELSKVTIPGLLTLEKPRVPKLRANNGNISDSPLRSLGIGGTNYSTGIYVQRITEDEYNALTVYEPNTLYLIPE